MKIPNRTNVQLIIKKHEVIVGTEFYFSISNAIERALELGLERCYLSFRDKSEKDIKQYIIKNKVDGNTEALVSYINDDSNSVLFMTFDNEVDLINFENNKPYSEIVSILNEYADMINLESSYDFHTGIVVKNFFSELKHEEKVSMYYSEEDKKIFVEDAGSILIKNVSECEGEVNAYL